MTAAVRSRSWMSRLDEKVEQLQFPVKVVSNDFNLILKTRKKIARLRHRV